MTAKITASADGTYGSLGVGANEAFRFGADNSGQLAGFRNKLINGAFNVQQRANGSLGSGYTYALDRWGNRYIGTAGSGTIISAVGSVKTRTALSISSLNLTSAYVLTTQRIESVNSKGLSSSTITFSVLFYHDFGAPLNVNLLIQKPAAKDDWTIANTQIGATITKVAASGAYTQITGSWTLNVAEADNGLEILVTHDPVTVSGKQYALAEAQLEEGSIATPFEQRPYGLELSLCQRYFELLEWGILSSYAVIASQSVRIFFAYKQRKRISPTASTITIFQELALNAGPVQYSYSSADGIQLFFVATAPGDCYANFRLHVSAEL